MSGVDSHPFRRLLVCLIEGDPIQRNTRKLAEDANKVGEGLAGFKKLNKALLNNWIRPKNNSTPQDWRQLAALLKTFDVDENLAEIMFRATTRGWDLTSLQQQASPALAGLLEFRQPILSFRQPTLTAPKTSPLEVVPFDSGHVSETSDSLAVIHFDTSVEPFQAPVVDAIVTYIQTDYQLRPTSLRVREVPKWKRMHLGLGIAAAVILVAFAAVVWLQVRPIQNQSNTPELGVASPEPDVTTLPVAPEPDTATTAPPASPERDLVSCEIALDQIPAANVFEKRFLTESGCEKIEMRLQYDKYPTDNLNPWDEALTACWAGGAQHRLWLRAKPEALETPGWIELQDLRSFDNRQSTVEIDLHAEPDERSEVVGSFLYSELAKRVDRLHFALPVNLGPDHKVRGLDEYHLAGCWKGSPRRDNNGVHFFYVK